MTPPRIALVGLALLTAPLAACDSDPIDEIDDEIDDDPGTITEVVVDDGDLTTLEAAVLEASIDDDLAVEGPITLFAPTDDAFADLLEALDATADELLARDDLVEILALHVVADAEIESGDLEAGQTVTTRNGGVLTVVAAGSGFGLDTDDDGDADAIITEADIEASNGVIHKIDSVLLPTDD
jgi:uncharacterized surface protein with fasciclin (FAS1) repeats